MGTPTADTEVSRLRAEVGDLRNLIEKLGATVNEQAAVIVALQAENKELREENDRLRSEVEQLRRRVFGASSEKMPTISSELRRRKKTKKGRKRRRKLTHEPRREVETEEVVHQVPEEERTCPHCPGVTLRPLGFETSVEYEFIPARFVRRIHRREKLCCPCCGAHIVTAPGPLKVYDKAQYGPGFIAHLVVAKCADSMPLYRQAKQLYRARLPIARSTLTDLFHRAASLLRPLVTRAEQIVAQAQLVQADETTFRIIEPIKCRKGYIWTFIGAGLIVYRFAPSRSGETPQRVLAGSSGTLLVDAYTGYNEVCEVEGRLRAGCLAHCRRKFFEAHSKAPDEAQHVLDLIVDLYANEREAEELDIVGTDAHLELRQSKSKPIMDELHEWLVEQKPLHIPKSPMAKAVGYALNQWDHLTVFLDDPTLPLDNNEAERRLRLIALGRKNYLFAADDEGAENLATLMTLVVSCEAHDINPEEYLADVLLRIQVHPSSRIDELLPPIWQQLRETGQLAPLPQN